MKPDSAAATSNASQSASLFQQKDYTRWCKQALQECADRERPAILFDSTIAEPREPLSKLLKNAFGEVITDRYTSVFSTGNSFAVAALAQRYSVAEDYIVCATGASSAFRMTLRALLSPGDHVLMERPGFDLLTSLTRRAGGRCSYFTRRAPDFELRPDEITAEMRPDTRLIVLTHLHNPSGAAANPESLKTLAAAAQRQNALVIVDEVYADFTCDGVCRPAAALAGNIISVNSLTKVYGLHGLRFGWSLAAPDVAATIRDANDGDESNLSKLSHAVAALVLENLEPFEQHWRDILARTRPVLARHAETMAAENLIQGAIPPDGCMYFPKVCDVQDSAELAEWLWRTHDVLVAPGELFGLPGHVRIGFGDDADRLDHDLRRFAEGLRDWRTK